MSIPNSYLATAQLIITGLQKQLKTMLDDKEPTQDMVYNQLLYTQRATLIEMAPAVSSMSEQVIAKVLSRVMTELGGDGIVVHGSPASWLQVTSYIEDKLPAASEDYRWVHLSSIQQVIPKKTDNGAGLGGRCVVLVEVGGKLFYASQRVFIAATVETVVMALLDQITASRV